MKTAGLTYEKFLQRQKQNGFYTRKQQAERKRQFLDNYLGIFETYFRRQGPGNIWAKLPKEARSIAVDMAMEYPESYIQTRMQEREQE